MINLYTDSTADLSPELLRRFNIQVIPLNVIIGEQTYKDGIDVHLKNLFELIEQYKELPKTAAPSVGLFLESFQQPGQNLFMGISSKLSATYQNALAASQDPSAAPTHVLDSLNLSTGTGLIMCYAAELRDQGLEISEIVTRVQSIIPKTHCSFIIETLDFLYKGGRCSAMENVVASLLSIRPVIEARSDGSLGVKAKTRGSRQKALSFLLEDFEKNLSDIDLHRVFITHTGCDDDALTLKAELAKMASIDEIEITYAGSVVASHCGPDTIGIIYREK